MSDKRKRAYCFTCNNYTDDDCARIQERLAACCKYIVVGKEVAPTTGTPHLQGFIYLKAAKTMSALAKMCPRNSWREAKCDDGNWQALYCSKECTWFEQGKPPVGQQEKGELGAQTWENVWKAAEDGRFDDIPYSIRFLHGRRIQEIRKDFLRAEKAAKREVQFHREFYEVKWLDWQEEIIRICSQEEADRRCIYWYWSLEGTTGKSWVTQYISETLETFVMSPGGNLNDYRHNYQGESVVICDTPRGWQGDWTVAYTFWEELKNGRYTSTKYEGGQRKFPRPHIVVFANYAPPVDGMSVDRWRVTEIKSKPFDV